MSQRLASKCLIACAIVVSTGLNGLAQTGAPGGIGLQPAQISEQLDESSMLEKASKILGYNAIGRMSAGMQQQGIELNSEGLIEGARLAVENQPMEITAEDIKKFNMILGNNTVKGMSKALAGQGLELNMESLLEGVKLAAEKKDLGIAPEDIQNIMSGLQGQMRQRQMEKVQMQAADNKAAGEAFLKANAEKEGVKELDGGVQYTVMKEGTGATPVATDRVKLHYHGTKIDGEVFDSSVDRNEPIEHSASGFVKGFNAAVQAMPVGSKWKVVIPSDLAYGMQGPLGPNQTLIFEIELLDILKKPATSEAAE